MCDLLVGSHPHALGDKGPVCNVALTSCSLSYSHAAGPGGPHCTGLGVTSITLSACTSLLMEAKRGETGG